MRLEEYENKKRKVEIVILVIITLLVIAIGVSYALWVLTKELTVDGAKEGRQIKRGKLKPSEEKKYELRIWIDEDVTKEDEIENKIYKSKIVVESVLGEKPYTEVS